MDVGEISGISHVIDYISPFRYSPKLKYSLARIGVPEMGPATKSAIILSIYEHVNISALQEWRGWEVWRL